MDRYDEVLRLAGAVQASGDAVTPEAVARRRLVATDLPESAVEDEERSVRLLLDELVEEEGLLERMQYRASPDGASPPVVTTIYLFTERGEEQLRALRSGDGGAS